MKFLRHTTLINLCFSARVCLCLENNAICTQAKFNEHIILMVRLCMFVPTFNAPIYPYQEGDGTKSHSNLAHRNESILRHREREGGRERAIYEENRSHPRHFDSIQFIVVFVFDNINTRDERLNKFTACLLRKYDDETLICKTCCEYAFYSLSKHRCNVRLHILMRIRMSRKRCEMCRLRLQLNIILSSFPQTVSASPLTQRHNFRLFLF